MLRRKLCASVLAPIYTSLTGAAGSRRAYGRDTGSDRSVGGGGGGGSRGTSVVAGGAWAHSGAAAVASAASTTATFWTQPVQYTAPADVKRRFALERVADKRSRFLVRNCLREDGVVSNLFPLSFAPAGKGAALLYVYEMYVTRKARPPPSPSPNNETAAAANATPVKRVSPNRSWQAVRRSLQQRFGNLPAMVQLDYKLYTAAPLPSEALAIPAEFHDLGWTACELRLLGRYTYADVPPSQLQELVNKIVPWVIAHPIKTEKGLLDEYSVVREKTGKLVCTSQGIASGGLRVFTGVLVQALFVDASAADAAVASAVERAQNALYGGPSSSTTTTATASSLSPAPPPPLEGSPTLAALAQGTLPDPIRFLVESFVRIITYKGKRVESYYIADSSGRYLASYWEPPATSGKTSSSVASHGPDTQQGPALVVGRVYRATHARVKDYPSRGNLRLFEFLADATTLVAEEPEEKAVARKGKGKAGERSAKTNQEEVPRPFPTDSHEAQPQQQQQQQGAGSFAGKLGLKIDTKGTIASETSLWEDVRQHFGPGPYDEGTQRRIAVSVQGTPVVTSFSLRQGIVRFVRFDAGAAAEDVVRLAGGGPPHQHQQQRAPSADGGGSVEEEERVARGSGAIRAKTDSTPGRVVLSNRLLDPQLVALLPKLDAHQPWAVLADYSAVPLQTLHCCFDPSMKGWQDIAISTLSLMPEKRMALLRRFQAVLAAGLRVWGLHLAAEPWRSRTVSLLPMPEKDTGKGMAAYGARGGQHQHHGLMRHPPPSAFPTSLLVIGIAGPRATAEEANRVSLTTQQMSAYFKTSMVAVVASEADAVRCMTEQLLTGGAALRDVNSAVIFVTPDRESRAVRWVQAECLCRGVVPLLMPPAATPKKASLLCGNARRQLLGKFEANPLRGIDVARNVPVLAGQRVLVVGVDSCHTNAVSTGAVVGILVTPERNHLLSDFWRHEARGREVQHVTQHFRGVLARAAALYDGLDQVVIFQDGDVFSELSAMKEEIAAAVPRCGLTFMCLHKRSNIRFVHDGTNRGEDRNLGVYNNLVKGNVIPALTPVPLDVDLAAPSFYLQTHESNMSTARTVEYTVHHTSPTLDVADVQQLANVMANVMAPQATKLPMSTRCAHKLADKAERLLDAVPQMRADAIPASLNERLWFL